MLALANGEKPEVRDQKSAGDPSAGSAEGADADSRANRFGNRSLTRSKIKRDGLKAGTPAPDFRLPRLDGRGELALEDLRGRRVLLVFSDPHCGPCNELAPQLEKFYRQNKPNTRPPSPRPSPPGKGESSPAVEVVMQQQWEISRRYSMFATPVAHLIDESGVMTHGVAVGVDPILNLLTRAKATAAAFSTALR